VPDGRPTISTHVLDVAEGAPRPGVLVRLSRVDGGWSVVSAEVRLGEGGAAGRGIGRVVGEGVTDADGRIPDLLAGAALEAGTYRLEIEPGAGFFARVNVDIRIEDATRSYHVPLLLSPYGITMYRGS
jgi:5-hydroxyisourate hydrolase